MPDAVFSSPVLPPAARPAVPVGPSACHFLPREHGSWSLALEPLALGLLVAPSWAGGALAAATLAGFFARRPLKAAFAPAHSGGTVAARRTLFLLSALLVAGGCEAILLGGLAALWPLVPAALSGGLFVHFDLRNASRSAAAELAGCTAFALVPAALASLAGWTPSAALALAAVMLARSAPTVLAVRTFLHLARGRPDRAATPLLAAAAAGLLLAWLAKVGLVPRIVPGLALLLLARAAVYVTALRPAWTARRVGLTEAVLGAVYVGVTALAYRL